MSDRLEALRLSGVEAERMAAEQISVKDADLKRATMVEAECRQFETSISDMLNADITARIARSVRYEKTWNAE